MIFNKGFESYECISNLGLQFEGVHPCIASVMVYKNKIILVVINGDYRRGLNICKNDLKRAI